jgi:hypothetical protein
MYHLFQNSRLKNLLATESIPFSTAMLLGETLYKFGSFTLECIAFLATWFVLSHASKTVASLIKKNKR